MRRGARPAVGQASVLVSVSRDALAGTLALLAACGNVNLDAGSDHPHGALPVDERNPIILNNDGARDNWQGEVALMLASSGDLRLAGIVVDATPNYPSLADNVQAWRDMVAAARASGMRNVPDPIASVAPPLVRPPSGDIDATTPNHSDGALFIIDQAARLSQPLRPVVVATGAALTDLADAYLVDHRVADEVVVVSSLGETTGTSISAGWPNGDLDVWASEIVVSRYRYVQVNTYYAQRDDVPPARAADLPANPFGTWMSGKLADIMVLHEAADQDSVYATVLPTFSLDVLTASAAGATPPAGGQAPTLTAGPAGRVWAVTRGANAAATARFWQALQDPKTFGP
ncbi:MAG TPA: hypothetical protein VGK52_14005 [Polyangia bacterium]